MKVVAVAAGVLVVLGVGLGSCRILAERHAPGQPEDAPPIVVFAGDEATAVPTVEPLPTSYAVDESTDVTTVEAAPTMLSTIASYTPTQEPTTTPTPVPTPTAVPPTPTRTAIPPRPTPTVVVQKQPVPTEPTVPEPAPSLVPVVPPREVYPSPGIGSPEAMGMEEKTLDYLNWARAQQGIQPYRMNPEMQELAREQALLYVQTREGTGQYPPAGKITAATRARRWFFREGGGPDPGLWLRWTFEEMENGYSLRYMPFYRNPKGTDIGIGFAFYSGNGVAGSAGGSIVVYVWNGEWDR